MPSTQAQQPTDGSSSYSVAVHTARDYYNSRDADAFYREIWGGEDIHVGLYTGRDDSVSEASQRTVKHMAQLVSITPETRVLDLGAGYGGAARWLARTYGCKVTCLNLSEAENERNRQKSQEQGLTKFIRVIDGSFESMPLQDSFLHAGDRAKVVAEIDRVVSKDKGAVIFTDPMAADDMNDTAALRPILQRLHLDTLGCPHFYKQAFEQCGFPTCTFEDHTEQVTNHYTKVLAELNRREGDLQGKVSPEYIAHMKAGLPHWIKAGHARQLSWGFIVASR